MRIAVALSGGVDSSVAALQLVRAGHEVVGITLQQWPRDDAEELERHGGCCSLSAVEDARRVAALLEIPFYVWNLEREFGERVIAPFHDAYRHGVTPNPCLRCNAFVRFDLMLSRVIDLGFDALATGHYARVVTGPDGSFQLLAARDEAKDQSYVLYHLDQAKLARVRFPLGDLTKPEVRELARSAGLPVAQKPESQELCFIPRGRTAEYLEQKLGAMPGPVVDLAGRQVGVHRGAQLYTVGQRNGLGLLSEPGPWYVSRVEVDRNRVVVGRRQELGVTTAKLRDVSFVAGGEPEPLVCSARLRYHARPVAATYAAGILELGEPCFGVAPGQAAVLYAGDRVLGGGIIQAA